MKEKYWFSTNGSGAIGHPQAKTNKTNKKNIDIKFNTLQSH